MATDYIKSKTMCFICHIRLSAYKNVPQCTICHSEYNKANQRAHHPKKVKSNENYK